jgi:hypothetical protein
MTTVTSASLGQRVFAPIGLIGIRRRLGVRLAANPAMSTNYGSILGDPLDPFSICLVRVTSDLGCS